MCAMRHNAQLAHALKKARPDKVLPDRAMDYLKRKEILSLYWISWYQPTEDCRPLNYPPNDAVLGWWSTGERCIDHASTICAWVRAENEDSARAAVLRDWPEADEWRFCELRDRIEPSSRFQPTNWMIERMAYNAALTGAEGVRVEGAVMQRRTEDD